MRAGTPHGAVDEWSSGAAADRRVPYAAPLAEFRRPRRRHAEVQLVDIEAGTRRMLARQYPQLRGQHVVAIAADAVDMAEVVELLHDVVHAYNSGRRAEVEDLVRAHIGRTPDARARADEEAKREAHVRARFLRDYPSLTARQVSQRAGSRATNPFQTVHNWTSQGRIFSVDHDNKHLYPAFQFGSDNRPLPVVRTVLQQIGHWPAWDVAAWFIAPSPVLDGRRPVEWLSDHPASVTEAAVVAARVS